MNRIVFIITFIIAIMVGYLLVSREISGSFLIMLVYFFALISIRRIYLKLTPWWDAPLKDIPKYFKEP